jgi:hypothetical protein
VAAPLAKATALGNRTADLATVILLVADHVVVAIAGLRTVAVFICNSTGLRVDWNLALTLMQLRVLSQQGLLGLHVSHVSAQAVWR